MDATKKETQSSDSLRTLMKLTKECGVEMSEEEAKSCLDQMKRHSALSDDELEGVTGGGGNDKPLILGCEDFLCKKDGRSQVLVGQRRLCDACNGLAMCSNCYYGIYDISGWRCQRVTYMKPGRRW